MELSDVYEKFKTPTFLTCPVCLEAFTDPRLLPCSHTVCLECINGIMTNTGRSAIDQNQQVIIFCCPICRSAVTVAASRNLPVNRALEDIIEDWKTRIKKERCHWLQNLIKNCAKHSQNADIWCKTCNLNICSTCAAPCEEPQGLECDSHSEHQCERIPDLERFCEDESSRLDEWIMVLPTVHEMFDIMKLLGTEESQLQKVQDKFLADLNSLENEITNLLSMKVSAVVTDMNKRMIKLVNHIQSRRNALCVALTELVDKFQTLGYSNSPSEIAKTEFKISIMNCKQLSKENMHSHESDVKEMVTDHRRLIAMCMKKMERFRKIVIDVDFQARSLVTLLRQLSETTRANSTNLADAQNRAPSPIAPMARARHRTDRSDPNIRGPPIFGQINPRQNLIPRIPAQPVGQPSQPSQPTFIVPHVPLMASGTHTSANVHGGVRFCNQCSLPYVGLASGHTHQAIPQIASLPRTPIFSLPQGPSPFLWVNDQRTTATPRQPIMRQATPFSTAVTSGNSTGNPQMLGATMLVVPAPAAGPNVQGTSADSTSNIVLDLRSQENNARSSPYAGSFVRAGRNNVTSESAREMSAGQGGTRTTQNETQTNGNETQDIQIQTNNSATEIMDYSEDAQSPINISPRPNNASPDTVILDHHDEIHDVTRAGLGLDISSSSEESL